MKGWKGGGGDEIESKRRVEGGGREGREEREGRERGVRVSEHTTWTDGWNKVMNE